MQSFSDKVLKKINPPADMSSFAEVEQMLSDPACITLCLESTFSFVKQGLQSLIENDIAGDVVLVGVWRGGLAIYLQALLIELGQTNRKLVLSDTFAGFVPVGIEHSRDKKMLDYFATLNVSAGGREEVIERMLSWGMSIENVCFLEGDVKETTANFDHRISMLLIDVDFYEPTMAAIENMYKCISPGGLVYIDDYGVEAYECKDAVDDFILKNGLNVSLVMVNKFGVSWRIG